jgi:valyl-tRNA synthetase
MAHQEIPKVYEAKHYEDEIYAAWEKSGFFNPDNLRGEPFTIMMPPPNVTGVLHLGHALENTMMDAMIRYQRMRGRKALLVPGTDHAAIATQARVEKNLVEQGIEHPREHFGRENLLELIRTHAERSKQTILSQIKKMGTSADWSRLAYTFDEPRNKTVNELFVQMYRDELIYRGYRIVNWSVKGQSTCSDDEIVMVERPAKLYTFKYSKDFPITISSTRPETKLGDTAVAVHPDDGRYRDFVGRTFQVDVGARQPLLIRIIADEAVDPTFGTGALGVTPAHSAIDFAIYERQKVAGQPIGIVPVIGADGRMREEAGLYAGLTVEEAREKFVLWLKDNHLLMAQEEITHNVGTSDRYGDVIEAIPMTQWWLDVNKQIPSRNKTLRELMREAVTIGLNGDASQTVKILPDRFTKLYLDRIDNLHDWCLSRQLWWGHRIPAWYRAEEIFVGTIPPQGEGWVQDEDTLDTWFSSASWTFSTLGWPGKTDDLKTFHPTSWIQMGYEIIYLWLMRMILMTAYALEEIPFHEVYIHGILRDKDGRKFSKSLGNGIDPIQIINEYSADALRFSLITGVSPGNDSRFYEEKVEAAQRLVNKLWNISRFILTSVEEPVHGRAFKELEPKTLADRWILSRLVRLEEEVSSHLQQAEFSQASETLREFTWSDFADWYLEIAKMQKGPSTDAILVYVLEHLLTYWHPIMPFVTEAIWKHLAPGELLMAHNWPVLRMIDLDLTAEREMETLQAVVTAIRNIRAQYAVSPKQKVRAVVVGGDVQVHTAVIESLAGVNQLTVESSVPTGEYASAVVGDIQVFVSLEGLVDKQAEHVKFTKALEEINAYIATLEQKLANQEFVDKAPAFVVTTMRQNLEDAKKKQALYVHDTES